MGEIELTEGDSKEKVNLKLSPKVGGQRKKVHYTILLGSDNPPLPCKSACYTGFFDSTQQNKIQAYQLFTPSEAGSSRYEQPRR